jgi:hypothetical protein
LINTSLSDEAEVWPVDELSAETPPTRHDRFVEYTSGRFLEERVALGPQFEDARTGELLQVDGVFVKRG